VALAVTTRLDAEGARHAATVFFRWRNGSQHRGGMEFGLGSAHCLIAGGKIILVVAGNMVRTAVFACFFSLFMSAHLAAETGYEAWLRYPTATRDSYWMLQNQN
jgi:hypothetical protein